MIIERKLYTPLDIYYVTLWHDYIFFMSKTNLLTTENGEPSGPKAYRSFTKAHPTFTKNSKKITNLSHLPREYTKNLNPSPILLVSAQEVRELTKEGFNLRKEKAVSSKISRFPSFHISQTRHKGASIHQFLAFFLIGNRIQLKKNSLQTADRPRWFKSSSTKSHIGHLIPMWKPLFFSWSMIRILSH